MLNIDLDTKITGVDEFGVSGRPGYLHCLWSVDSPDRQQSSFRRLHAQSDGCFEIGNVRQSEWIEGHCRGNVLSKNFLVNPNALCYLRPRLGSERVEAATLVNTARHSRDHVEAGLVSVRACKGIRPDGELFR